MMRVELGMGGAFTVAREGGIRRSFTNVRAIGRSGTVLTFVLNDAEVLELARALIANGEAEPIDVELARELRR